MNTPYSEAAEAVEELGRLLQRPMVCNHCGQKMTVAAWESHLRMSSEMWPDYPAELLRQIGVVLP